MVAVAFVCDFVATGFFFYSYGVFFKALAGDFGGSRLGVSLGLTISGAVGALAAPTLGSLLDRTSIRRTMIVGALAVSTGFVLLSRVGALWQYYLVLASFVAIGLNAMGGLAAAKLVANWFVARRGAALGVATVGISFSGLVMPPVATWMVASVGWRGGFLAYGVATLLVVVPVVALGAIDRPEILGQTPDGERAPAAAGDHPRLERSWRTDEILGSHNFWATALCFALAFASLSAVLTHLVPHATDAGIPPYQAAWALSAAAGTGMASKVAFGWLSDRLDARVAVGGSLAAQFVGVLLLLRSHDLTGLLAAALVFGFGMGGIVPLQSAVTGIAFGRLSFGKVSGLMRPFMIPVGALGVPMAGWIHDRTDSYELAFRLFLLLYLLAGASAASLRLGGAGSRRASPGCVDPAPAGPSERSVASSQSGSSG
jgi:MFS family permease